MSAVRVLTAQLLTALGDNPDREGLQQTPHRVERFYAEFLTPAADLPCLTTFDAEGTDEMIVMRAIPFYSLCEHHLLPFFGTATVGYVPAAKIVGLSKLPRLVRHFAHRLQNQERLTGQVADALATLVEARGVGVILTARHLCMEMRGIRLAGSETITSALRGVFLTDAGARREFLQFRHR